MATFIRQKEALRAAAMGFLAGAHCVTEEVDKMQGLVYSNFDEETSESAIARREMLEANYDRFLNSTDNLELYAAILIEEELYPFGSLWSSDILSPLTEFIIPLSLSFNSEDESVDPTEAEIYRDESDYEFSVDDIENPERLIFKFQKGYKKNLNELAATLNGPKMKAQGVDHWLMLLLNTAFHAGMSIAAQMSENAQAYYDAIEAIENEQEAWSRYPQLVALFERQLRRETRKKTGLVSDLDI